MKKKTLADLIEDLILEHNKIEIIGGVSSYLASFSNEEETEAIKSKINELYEKESGEKEGDILS
jgi:hypothetical protein